MFAITLLFLFVWVLSLSRDVSKQFNARAEYSTNTTENQTDDTVKQCSVC